MEINTDEITVDFIEEFKGSLDSYNIKAAKIKKEKEIIFKQRKVWINILSNDEWIGSDLLLDSDGIIIDNTKEKIRYKNMLDIEITTGGWSKNKFKISTDDSDIIFEINEDKAVPLKEIIEDNIDNQNRDEIDALLELYELFDEGKISEEELEVRKALIYSDDRFCTNCGAKLESDAEFCSNCGFQVFD
ncbi:zinc ribbon domain-containing protein [uncultured Methanobrevibacter sp.]|uniref:zinc ribbon domain-containing protein n=1 Tax=uncultured Methanobrevibacter sp. TaxID=253161 RepID=UPI002634CCA0|nr:zinc-ribbon domain-containing protein [uncultured Methanobrevibacter sp.]